MVKIIVGYNTVCEEGVLKIAKEDNFSFKDYGENGVEVKIRDGKTLIDSQLTNEKHCSIIFEDQASFDYFLEKLRYEFVKKRKPIGKIAKEMRLRVLELDRTMKKILPGYKKEKKTE